LNPKNCEPELKTLNYLKKNLLYCFEPQTRSQLKEQIENLEDNFFTAATQQQTATPTEADAKNTKRRAGFKPRQSSEASTED